jgi:hypothetical protein
LAAVLAPFLYEFMAVAANALDTVTVSTGHQWRVVASWGYLLWFDGAHFDHVTKGTAASTRRGLAIIVTVWRCPSITTGQSWQSIINTLTDIKFSATATTTNALSPTRAAISDSDNRPWINLET